MKNKEAFVDYEKCSGVGKVTYKARCPFCKKLNVVTYCLHENCEKEVFYDTCKHYKGFGAGSFRFVKEEKGVL